MKKTIIAAALAATTGVAMADVSVSGRVEQIFTHTDVASTNEWVASTDHNLVFQASEDLGNGMTAFAKIALDADNTTDHSNQDQLVGLKGSFGTIMMGEFEAFVEGKVAPTMTMAGQAVIEGGDNVGRIPGGIAYVSPSMNGLTIGVGGYAVDDTTADADVTGDETNRDDALDATEVALMYANGGLDLKVAVQDVDGNTTSATQAEKTTAISASYTMGDLKVSALTLKSDNVDDTAADDRTDNAYRIDYTMGSNKITLAHKDDETTNGANGNDITALELVHSLSKRTQVYVGMTDQDTANADTTYFGMQHSF